MHCSNILGSDLNPRTLEPYPAGTDVPDALPIIQEMMAEKYPDLVVEAVKDKVEDVKDSILEFFKKGRP